MGRTRGLWPVDNHAMSSHVVQASCTRAMHRSVGSGGGGGSNLLTMLASTTRRKTSSSTVQIDRNMRHTISQGTATWRSYTSSGGSAGNQTRFGFGATAVVLVVPAWLWWQSASPVLLESAQTSDSIDENDVHHPKKPSLQTIKDAVEHPDEDEFLVSASMLDDEARRKTLVGRTVRLVTRYVWEPIRTSLRFVHLALLFLPVLLASPVLVLEYVDQGRDKRRGYSKREGERATTRWWYRLLVHQMERAGPTFIKVGSSSQSPSGTHTC